MADETLLAETKRVAEAERRSMAELLALPIEVGRRELHLALGHSSLFGYCMRVLHFSEQAASSRITAARAARRFPQILDLLAKGALTLSSVGILAPHLTEETAEPIFEAAAFKSTREVERLLASLHPQPDIPASVRAVPTGQAALLACATEEDATRPTEMAAPQVPSRKPREILAPLAPKRYMLR